jgi:hypothetical protein
MIDNIDKVLKRIQLIPCINVHALLTALDRKDCNEGGEEVNNVQSQSTIDAATAAEEVLQNCDKEGILA